MARTGRGKFKIIETNPADSQGYSGFFDQYGSTLGRHADLYKALTGRTAPYRAALAGGAAAGAAGVAANVIDNFVEESKNKKVSGPYKPGNV